jgi:hypothetical protein
MNLHIVELNEDRDFFPQVVSSPSNPIESLEETPSFDLASNHITFTCCYMAP